jgi:hypothetical protein
VTKFPDYKKDMLSVSKESIDMIPKEGFFLPSGVLPPFLGLLTGGFLPDAHN